MNPTRPPEVLGFEELLSELIARARMLRPRLEVYMSVEEGDFFTSQIQLKSLLRFSRERRRS